MKQLRSLNIGDQVEIINPGFTYDRYESWANYWNLVGWVPAARCVKGERGIIVCVGTHSLKKPKRQYFHDDDILIAVKIDLYRNFTIRPEPSSNYKIIIIAAEGVKFIEAILSDDLFEI